MFIRELGRATITSDPHLSALKFHHYGLASLLFWSLLCDWGALYWKFSSSAKTSHLLFTIMAQTITLQFIAQRNILLLKDCKQLVSNSVFGSKSDQTKVSKSVSNTEARCYQLIMKRCVFKRHLAHTAFISQAHIVVDMSCWHFMVWLMFQRIRHAEQQELQ